MRFDILKTKYAPNIENKLYGINDNAPTIKKGLGKNIKINNICPRYKPNGAVRYSSGNNIVIKHPATNSVTT